MSMTQNSPQKTLRILLVEDDENYAYSVIHSLEKIYTIDHTKTEAEALRMLYIESYDLLLLDLNLTTGYLSGFQFLDYLSRLERFKELIIIGVSGMSIDDIYGNSSFNKLHAFLVKPVSKELLERTIKDCTNSVKTAGNQESHEAEETAGEEFSEQ